MSYSHIHSPYGGYYEFFIILYFYLTTSHRKEVIHTMKLVCPKSELQKSVSIVMKAVPSKTTMPILECILIDASTNDIKFTSNDMELGIETIVDGTIEEKASSHWMPRYFPRLSESSRIIMLPLQQMKN